jgi:6-phosphogluconolactonase (cycloisomerase 2 family)
MQEFPLWSWRRQQSVPPRNMTISPSGDLLFVANQVCGNVVVFKINHATGHLDLLEGQMHVSQAAGVAPVEVEN